MIGKSNFKIKIMQNVSSVQFYIVKQIINPNVLPKRGIFGLFDFGGADII